MSKIALNQKNMSWWLPVIILILATSFYVYEFTVRVMPSAMNQQLMRDFLVGSGGLGLLSSFFYYGYASMQIPAGLLYDRFGARRLLTFAMAVAAISTLFFSVTHSYTIAVISRFFIGFGGSFAFIGCLVLASRWFPNKYFAMIAGFVQFMGCIGAIAGEAPISRLLDHFTWRTISIWTGIIGLGLALLIWSLVRNDPNRKNAKSLNLSKQTNKSTFKLVVRNSQTWWIALYSFCSWSPIVVIASLWGIPFLATRYHINDSQAALGIAIVWIGIATGSPLLGWWSNYIGRRNLPLGLCMLLGFITSIFVLYVPHISWQTMCLVLFVFGLSASGQTLSFGVVQDNNPPSVAGTAIGFNNMAVIFGGVILQPLVGWLLDLGWHGQTLHGAPVYSLESYQFALSVVPLVALIGFLVTIFGLQETKCRPQYQLQKTTRQAQTEVVPS